MGRAGQGATRAGQGRAGLVKEPWLGGIPNKCDLNVEPKKQTELNENDKCSNQNKKTKVSSDPFISSKKNKSDAIQCNFSSNVNSDFFSNDDTLSKDCQLQSTKNTFGRFPK